MNISETLKLWMSAVRESGRIKANVIFLRSKNSIIINAYVQIAVIIVQVNFRTFQLK